MAITVLSPGMKLQAQNRHVKVTVDLQQSGTQSEEDVRGTGGVIITRRGFVQPSARLRAQDAHTSVQRSAGIFTLVGSGSESILTVATKVPYRDVVYYRDYATGRGYVATGVAFHEVGASLKVNATIIDARQIRVRLTPRISYFSPDRAGAVDLTEAATELVVTNGEPVSLGGVSTQLHEVTWHILGFGERRSTEETAITLTATIQ
jgi:type II secretory pathway component GspD/PulD (secretin)